MDDKDALIRKSFLQPQQFTKRDIPAPTKMTNLSLLIASMIFERNSGIS